MLISIAIPCYNSSKTLPLVVEEIQQVFSIRPEYEYQILLVNDNSPDNTYEVIGRLCAQDSNIIGIDLSKNYGQASAQMAAIQYAKGDIVVYMDDYNLQKLLRLWLQGITNFSIVPLRISSIIGMVSAVLGFIYGIVLIVQKLINPNVFLGYTSLMAAILVIGGLLMIMVGILGEYVGRIYILLSNMPQYNIREVIGKEESFEEQ